MNAAKVEDGLLEIDPAVCNNCGRCIGTCHFDALTAEFTGYKIYIGGRWGKHVAQGRALDKVFADKDEALNVIEKAILLFREQGKTGERFSDTIERLGFENVQKQLLSGLEAEKRLGITLTDGYLMVPTKSVTAVIGLGRQPAGCVPEGCEACEKRDCKFRR